MAPIKDTFPSAYDACILSDCSQLGTPGVQMIVQAPLGLTFNLPLIFISGECTPLTSPSLHKDHLPGATWQNKTVFLSPPHSGPWGLHAGTTFISIGIVFVVLFFFFGNYLF